MAEIRLKKNGEPAKTPGRKPSPDRKKSQAKGFGPGVARPHVWLVGPDKQLHDMYTPWMKARAQAHFRGEDWELTFDDWVELWKDNWLERGRARDAKCMSRRDPDGAWSPANTIVITRHEHLKLQAEHRRSSGIGYKGQPVKRRVRKTKEEVKIAYTKMKVTK